MKILLLFLFPICLFAQVELQIGNLKNKLIIPFAQSIAILTQSINKIYRLRRIMN